MENALDHAFKKYMWKKRSLFSVEETYKPKEKNKTKL